jgi:hypothetical protein
MPDPNSIHIQVGNDLSGVVNLGSIQGDVSNQANPSTPSTETSTCAPQGGRGVGRWEGLAPSLARFFTGSAASSAAVG